MTNEDVIKEFREMLASLDDVNSNLDLDAPIKGDIYFDGIEAEAFLLQKLAAARADERKKMKQEMKYSAEMFFGGFSHPKDCPQCRKPQQPPL